MRAVAAGLGLLLAAATACASATSSADEGRSERGELVVLGAASLGGVLGELGQAFEAEHDVRVVVSTGASSALAQQVVHGAPADVFASASPAVMDVVVDAGQADGEPVVVARNRLQIAVPSGNPGGVRSLADLARPELDVAVCAVQVPCGAAAEEVFAGTGLAPAPDTLEQDVRAVLTKVRLGEVDAGLVWVTDVLSAPEDVEGVAFPEADAAVSDYPAVALRGARDPEAARAFVALLRSPQGRAVLAAAGFDAPA